MQKVAAIVRRELIAYFSSPIAYMVLSAFLLLQGLIFFLVLAYLNDPVSQAMAPMEYFFGGTIFFWLFELFVIPVITMRLIAEERRSRTIEILLTSPLTEGQVIAGKFAAAFLFYLVLWLPTGLYPLMLKRFSDIDLGPVVAGYLGILFVGFLFLAIGTFASTLTSNQLIAAIIAFAALVVLFSVPLFEQLMVSTTAGREALGYIDLWSHMEDYGRGIVDTRHMVLELSAGLFFLFLAAKSLEARKVR